MSPPRGLRRCCASAAALSAIPISRDAATNPSSQTMRPGSLTADMPMKCIVPMPAPMTAAPRRARPRSAPSAIHQPQPVVTMAAAIDSKVRLRS